MTGDVESELTSHLLRPDGQEDLCFATWVPSTGHNRMTAIIRYPILPDVGERHVHGNASYESAYALRAAKAAAEAGHGVAFMHSHPHGFGWQPLNETDRTAEVRIANMVREITGFPLVGLTLAGDRSWSARRWMGVGKEVAPETSETIRVVGSAYSVTFNETLVPKPPMSSAQVRTIHTWGEETQAKIARLRVAVAGAGSVGMAIVDALARTGIQHIGVFDFDTVEAVNLDRLHGTRPLDALLKRPKVHVAQRLLKEGSTAVFPCHELCEFSICEPEGFARILDYDIVFSCVDRPWPRHVLNTLAYADLIPVIEGGISAFRNTDDTLRNAYWRSTVVRPGRPCLKCLGQYDPALVEVERDGSLDDPSYIANLPADSPIRRRENVAVFSVSATAALLQQFISYVAQPSGIGDPGPLCFNLRDHKVKRDSTTCDRCSYQNSVGFGDSRLDPTEQHEVAEQARIGRADVSLTIRAGRVIDDVLSGGRRILERLLYR